MERRLRERNQLAEAQPGDRYWGRGAAPAAHTPRTRETDEHRVWLSHPSAACDRPRAGRSGRKQLGEAVAFFAWAYALLNLEGCGLESEQVLGPWHSPLSPPPPCRCGRNDLWPEHALRDSLSHHREKERGTGGGQRAVKCLGVGPQASQLHFVMFPLMGTSLDREEGEGSSRPEGPEGQR